MDKYLKAVIFDMDGTLVDTEIVWYKAWKIVNQEFSLGLSDEVLRSFIGMPKQTFDEILDQLMPKNIDMKKINDFKKSYYDCYEDVYGISVKPGVIQLLEYLKENKIRMAICTSTFKYRAIPTLKKVGLYNYFELIKTGDDVEKGKPDPEIYIKTLKLLDLNANECIAIEDSAFGVKSATSAHLKTYFVKDINDLDGESYKLIEKRLNTVNELIKEGIL